MKKRVKMRIAMAMIELIFAIVIIAISVITIPTMMSVAGDSTKKMAIDDDVMSRLNGTAMDKFQARWGGEYEANESKEPASFISFIAGDLNCSRVVGAQVFRANADSNAECNMTQLPNNIPADTGSGADGNVSRGLEMLNGGTETISITSSTGETLGVDATYNVRYVPSSLTGGAGTATEDATWTLGSSGSIDQDNGGVLTVPTHLKRVVIRFSNTGLGVDTTLTFFKSNKGN